MQRIVNLLGALALFAGVLLLALTAYLWFGNWPQQARQIVDFERSVRENAGRAPDPLIENVGARKSTTLNGVWQAVIDPMDKAETFGVAPRADQPKDPSDLSEFSFENGLTLKVPGDWNTQDPRLGFYQGVVWYKRTFDYQPVAGERTYLYFGAANYAAWIYLNGKLVGMHEGGFTPFNFDVSSLLKPGENLLVVKVDNRMRKDDVPTPVTDWLNYGGLTRDVLLVQVPETFMRSASAGLSADGLQIAGKVILDGPQAPNSVTVRIPELDAELTAPVKDNQAVFSLPANPRRWSPEDPKLYRVEFVTAQEQISDDIGFRQIATRGTQILLNGQPVFLRGISLHEEAFGDHGRAHGAQDAEQLLTTAKALGCNFVRLAHYTHDEAMQRAADKLGLMVWGEIPVYWSIDFANPKTLQNAKQQMSEMIARDQNRASVVIWSAGNETPVNEQRMEFFRQLIAHIRAEDPTRLVSAALLSGAEATAPFLAQNFLPALAGYSREQWDFNINDPLGELVDIVSVNEYFAWYEAGLIGHVTPIPAHKARDLMLVNMDRIRIHSGYNKPLLISEFGADAKLGERAPEADYVVLSEDYQALVYRRQFAMLDRQPDLAGMSPWVLKDFRAPLRMFQGKQDYWNRKGLVSNEGERKLAFNVLRDYYRERAGQAGVAFWPDQQPGVTTN